VWGPDYGDEPEYLRVFINQLRKKIEANPAKADHHFDRTLGGYRLRGGRTVGQDCILRGRLATAARFRLPIGPQLAKLPHRRTSSRDCGASY